MPTYMLEGQSAVRLTPKPLTIALQMSGPVQGRLVALVNGAPLENAVRPRPELLILPQVNERVTLRIEPVGAEVFAQGSRANVSVSANDPGAADPERAVLPPVDLAGLSMQDALSVERADDGLRVRSEIREVVRVKLGPLADAARVVATELIGRQRLDDHEAIDVAIAIDASASFRRHAASGQLRRVIDVIEGIASVVDPDRISTASILTEAAPVASLAATAESPLSTTVERTLAEGTPETGAPLASGATSALRELVARTRDGGRALTFVVTDAAPADRAAFEHLAVPGTSVAHLVVIGRGTAWRLQQGPDAPSTLFDLEQYGAAPTDDATPDPLASQLPALRPLVSSLLQGRPQ